jgi:hypothetical protein
LLDIGSHIGYLQRLFCKYPESDKGRTTHRLYGGLPLWGDLTDYNVNPMGDLITDSDNILKGVSSPSWVSHTYSSEGGPFSATLSYLCAFGFFFFGVLFDF